MNDYSPSETDLETALREYPLARMPHSLTGTVLAQIQQTPQPALWTWRDVLIGLVLALSLAALVFASQFLPPVFWVKLQIQGILFYQSLLVNARWLIPTSLFGLAAFISSLTLPTLIRTMRLNRI